MSSRRCYRFHAQSPPFGEFRPGGVLTPPPCISEVPSVGTESDTVPKDSVNPPSKDEVRPRMKVGDYRNFGNFRPGEIFVQRKRKKIENMNFFCNI